MVKKTKLNNERLDKYYHMAKEQGYRSRAAFKLVQLNKKYDFLGTARVMLDLCAAPGGWLQVAKKFMPVNSTLVGVDLCPIKAIPHVTTIQGDITTKKTMTMVKNVLRGQKCDVVLHDGAPNVGANWLKDAFSQSELCLFALKMATEFLKPEGLFITKVFRSKDYTSLMWVLNQFFTKVEATKPKASRDASAEIFVVCFGYKAPKEIDPKLFDASLVFEDVESQKKKLRLSFKDLAQQQKKPNREGYEEGMTLLYKKRSIAEFVESDQPIKFLVDYNELEFDEASQIYLNHPLTTKDIIEACEDLRVLGKPDFRMLLKWRKNMKDYKDELDADNDEDIIEQDEEDEVMEPIHEDNELSTGISNEMDIPSDEEELDGELKELKNKQTKIEKKKEKKVREKQKKLAIKAAVERQEDMLDTIDDGSLFRMNDISSKDMLDAVLDPSLTSKVYNEYLEKKEKTKEQLKKQKEAMGRIELDEEEEDDILEAELDALYQQLMDKKTRRFKANILQTRDLRDQTKSELYDAIQYEEEKYGAPNTNPLLIEHKELGSKQTKANQFFDQQNIFSVLMEEQTGNSDDEDENGTRTKRRKLGRLDNITEEELAQDSSDSESEGEEDDDDGDAISEFKRKASEGKKQDVGGFEVMPKEMNDPEVRATALALGKKLLRKKERREFIDSAFHRYAFNDEDVPDWLADDEAKSYRKQDPITREEADEIKRKMAEIDAKPIKAVLEAKIRRKIRAQKKIKMVKEKADVIAQSQEMTPQEKSKELMKLYKDASVKTQRKKVYVVAGGKKIIGKKAPGSIMKFVDNRTKKDKRATDAKKRKR
ncbi:rRNA (uridine-2'-O-)-methyltransferase [Naegleria gruberi]|uniref:Putative rRNA methyltransferase n=1 Tax=Naegleria gruberi TaxID=5762 RepID=D2V1Q2_NAEGR|nr:rRNA (uridine-2'-O-)-methyltransferase [Naegleria gruberi]EFC49201.1 rRNA (uridine-2'-O-)-methyltransferase [Naegleria gruberi]|eukprot:XP_002681945.1 rRNA (uridine-2'-O-)-methyltransferase [Naegleria gruberi strain NEG-M]